MGHTPNASGSYKERETGGRVNTHHYVTSHLLLRAGEGANRGSERSPMAPRVIGSSHGGD